MPKVKLHYFDLYARAEPIRLLLTHAKVSFEDVRYSFEDAEKLKQTGILEFGQMPVLEIDGKFYAQSISIMRYLGVQHGYYSNDSIEGWKIDSIIDGLLDLQQKYWKAYFESDAEKKKELYQKMNNDLPTDLAVFEKRL